MLFRSRALGMVISGRVTAIDGSSVPVWPRSLCVHGDTPGAVAVARGIRDALLATGTVLAAFAEESAQ